MKRRIAAILVADIVGFSSLMESDEDGTAKRLARCRTLIDAEIAKMEGRLFKAMGDAVLVEFASPINAVRCATNIRAILALAEQSDSQPLHLRFGLHLADVLVENDDLIGDGVNLAARIQQAAEPDAIDVSGPLFEQIRRTRPSPLTTAANSASTTFPSRCAFTACAARSTVTHFRSHPPSRHPSRPSARSRSLSCGSR